MYLSYDLGDEIELVVPDHYMAQEIFDLVQANKDHLAAWLPWVSFVKEVKDSEQFIKDILIKQANYENYTYFIYCEKKLVGVIGVDRINASLKKGTIGYWLSKDQNGKGIMGKAVQFVLQQLFATYEFEKVEIAHAVGNLPSQKVIEKAGFVKEGVIRHAEKLDHGIVDHVVYGMMKSDYEALK